MICLKLVPDVTLMGFVNKFVLQPCQNDSNADPDEYNKIKIPYFSKNVSPKNAYKIINIFAPWNHMFTSNPQHE